MAFLFTQALGNHFNLIHKKFSCVRLNAVFCMSQLMSRRFFQSGLFQLSIHEHFLCRKQKRTSAIPQSLVA